MRPDDLNAKMRIYETAYDMHVLPGLWMVARIDGRNFSHLTRHARDFDAPFDTGFHEMMLQTTTHLMQCGFRVIYGYTQSDEISLLMHRDEDSFGRRLRKLHSVLAGEASACFSAQLGAVGAFDCRICTFPTPDLVIDYFRWRSEDAYRNALNGHCYWTLRAQGMDAKQATQRLKGLSLPDKHEFLFQEAGLNFNDLPAWQRRGAGIYWETFEVQGTHPKTGQTTTSTRRRLKQDLELPRKDAYVDMIWAILRQEHKDLSTP